MSGVLRYADIAQIIRTLLGDYAIAVPVIKMG
jgi:hypothetical protein